MDETTKALKGSPNRDAFKQRHKELSKDLWACDIDFCLVEKYPFPDIVAAIDYKTDRDSITFSEVIAYNSLVSRGIDVFIVQGDAEVGAFSISKYIGGNHQRPDFELRLCIAVKNWAEFEEWEKGLRLHKRTRFSKR
jgi:hypothetical protein